MKPICPSILGDFPRFHERSSPLYDIGGGRRLTRDQALEYLAEIYGSTVIATAYNVTSINDKQDVFIFTQVEPGESE